MKLTLHIQPTPQGPARAAFLAGGDPMVWLSTIQSWNVDPQELEVYAVPRSIRELHVTGLLLVHIKGNFPAQVELREAYQCVGSSLLIPQYASMSPQVGPEEWKNLLVYDWHFYHPGIGMVGFQRSDRVQLHDLLHYPTATEQDWSLAQSGSTPLPLLRQISVQPSTMQEMFANVESVGDKSLKDLLKNAPKDENESGDLRLTLLNGLDNLLNKRPKLQEGESQGLLGKWLDQLQQRILQNIEDLRKQRDDEINRLLKLFQDDPDEALRYSIPLNSPYEGRGIAPPSGQLGRKDPLDFNLGGLGGGAARDNWGLDAARRAALHQHYLKVANQKIADGDFRKAAYIHAHLLGDFYTAANVLEQGKHYHEAAQLYLDHLKNPGQAARCFEQAGLYSAAIPIYLELGNNEKAGDLYILMDQVEEAQLQYQGCVEAALSRADYLDAARLYQSKLHDDAQAKSTLLNGWQQNQSPIACLNRYFDFFQQASNEEFDREVQTIYQTQVKPMQHSTYMEVLKEIGKNTQRRGNLPLARDIVYSFVSKELLAEKLDHLSMLNTFVPKDRLLQGDASRFSAEMKTRKAAKRLAARTDEIASKKAKLHKELPLEVDKSWTEARIINHSLIVLGKEGASLYLFCSDLQGNHESYPVGRSLGYDVKNQLFALPDHSHYLGITRTPAYHQGVNLVLDVLGNELHWMDLTHDPGTIAFVPVDREKIARFTRNSDGSTTLHYIDVMGQQLESMLVTNIYGHPEIFPALALNNLITMQFRRGYFFFVIPGERYLYRMDHFGQVTTYELTLPAIKMAISDENTVIRLVVYLKDGQDTMTYGCQYFRMQNGGVSIYSELFEQGAEPDCLLFMGQGLIVTEKNQVRLYDTPRNGVPRRIAAFELEEFIVDAFKGPSANQVGFLTKDGKVLFYEIGELNG
ncbi:hypothetical protein [Haliscomenobacter hydrossis]|uniref:MoxR-vWA-beta-propeller ternary system domain-containing protein n=1 Tax=Haliscomenobacter hydrossis (strain ATCC 27775 / DSM 1100 / LMG 10767 / O) TaxID=760192 RepID=F4L0C8_HALH1|nr:hypothetical protein [Haliscomenobacter hydrossis]AEE53801.1 hypothetical protein Halhy_5978 [Haliscomenobacter hydrossis DSM 1100]